MAVKCSFVGEYVKAQLMKEIFSMALLKVFILCHGVDHAVLSILLQLDSSLKKYVGLVHTWNHGMGSWDIHYIHIYIYAYILLYILYIHTYIYILPNVMVRPEKSNIFVVANCTVFTGTVSKLY